jgi:hypothetical protein
LSAMPPGDAAAESFSHAPMVITADAVDVVLEPAAAQWRRS